jgi:hypothetical protein
VVRYTFGWNFHFESADHCISNWLKGFGARKNKFLLLSGKQEIWHVLKENGLMNRM